MRLGVFFIGNPQSGGLYQYSLSVMESLRKRSDKIVVFNLSGADFPAEKYGSYFQLSKSLTFVSWLRRWGVNLFRKHKPPLLTQAKGAQKETVNRKNNLLSRMNTLFLRLIVKMSRIDLLIFTAPNSLSFKLGMPYVMPVHDLQHRLNPHFPEVSADGIWEEREYLYRNSILQAEAILVDSETSREDVRNLYQIDEWRVKVLPYVPPSYLRGGNTEEERNNIREKYRLPQRFVFYPANFWRHKNHKLLIEALYRIKTEQDLRIPAVFVGSRDVPYGVFEEVQELTKRYGIEDQVIYLGYISNEDMGYLYQLAEAMVMPTFFGPTNIPYLEAFSLGCPVVGSDIRGIREQVGDAGLLVNPNSPEDLVAAILRIWNDVTLRETLRRRGYDRIKVWNFERFSEALNKIIDETGIRIASMS